MKKILVAALDVVVVVFAVVVVALHEEDYSSYYYCYFHQDQNFDFFLFARFQRIPFVAVEN